MALSISLIVVALALAILSFVMAFGRRDSFLSVCMAAFVLVAAAFALFQFQLTLNPWAGVVIPNLVLLLAHLLFPFGVRVYARHPRAWPWRFWLYFVSAAVMLIFFEFSFESYCARAIGMSLFIILCTLEYLQIVISSAVDILKRTRYAVAFFISFATIFHGARIIILALGVAPASMFMQTNLITSITFLGTIFYMILWGGGIFLLDSARLISQMSEANKRLEELALQDELTGLLNRHSLDQSIRSETDRQDRYLSLLTAVMVDVDHFKLVNDTFGHDAGDRVLVEIARRVRSSIRESDMLFRWGGEEFLILALNTGVSGACALAEKIRKIIASTPVEPAGTVTVSCGVAERNRGDANDIWFDRVDKALYRAKQKGRNRVEVWGEQSEAPFSMVQIYWNTEWNSGNITIDREHRELLRRGNQLLNMSLNGTAVEEMRPLLEELIDHIRSHFRHEEEILGEVSYPDIKNHHTIHDALLGEAEMLYENYRDNIIRPSLLFHLLVDRIVMEHMLTVDVKYYSYLKSRAASIRVRPALGG